MIRIRHDLQERHSLLCRNNARTPAYLDYCRVILSTLPKILPHFTAFRVIFGFDVFDPTNTLVIVAINLALLK
jgi:hypothetical protein